MKTHFLALLFSLFVSSAFAQVTVRDPWVRATVPAQKATGAFMQVISLQDARLVEVRSPLADVVEIHEMKMENDVMRMRAVPGIDLPAGQRVDLKSGGYHIMLIDIKRQVKEGETVPLTLVVEGKDKQRQTLELNVPARALTNVPDHSSHSKP
ncbi:copper chaperone PCu(A)C [Polaromonas sp.]|uniref:copper chaperone PCu(A)C n=1 Tax=Polaromonas sp. TaxID=1869339 RepID=UPI0017C4944C|nr:copper chaperone PCu(A)C [Polaromonas sp.]NMM05959.1 copper chaperone PCu(A)C [Polaromonas sp.]